MHLIGVIGSQHIKRYIKNEVITKMSQNVKISKLTFYIEGSLEDGNIYVTAASLFSLFTLQCCQDFSTSLIFVKKPCTCVTSPNLECQSKLCNNLIFRIKLSQLQLEYKFILLNECPEMVSNCYFPLIHEESQNYCIIGLCSSLRYILTSYSNVSSDGIYSQLLGFRKSCLQACAEVSVWTKFCEIDSVDTLTRYYNLNFEENNAKRFEIPANIIRFEYHLMHPPILHNALKQKQKSLQETSSPAQFLELKKKKLVDLPNLEHKFAEGVDITLADILLYVTISLIHHKISNRTDLEKVCPLVLKWLSFMDTIQCIIHGKSLLKNIIEDFLPIPSIVVSSFSLPKVNYESLYKSDPQRYKPRWRSFTHQKDIENIFQKLNKFTVKDSHDDHSIDKIDLHIEDSDVLEDLKCLSLGKTNSLASIVSNLKSKPEFNWESFPLAVHPIEGQLPTNRIKRKLQQLESIAKIVIDIAQNNDVIVDFCAGGGHLGILLAYCLPFCKILLVENKKNSIDKARSRIKTLNLNNVYFYQCNLDYFDATFDIGVSLHACGVATDLIMLKCVKQKAAFVCCPCCYGSIQPNHILNYPRSSHYSNIYEINISEYLILAHAADQTHDSDNPKTMQGKECMKLVDYDRLSFAETLGYETILITMNPPDCSPKNHILIGIRPSKIQPVDN